MNPTLQALTQLTTVLTTANIAIPIVFGAIQAIGAIIRGVKGDGPTVLEIADMLEAQIDQNDQFGKAEIARLKALIGVLLLALLIPTGAYAQTSSPALPTSVDLMVLPSTGDPVTSMPIATRNTVIGATLPVCNQAAPTGTPPNPLVNPTTAFFDDPFTTGRVCIVPIPTGLPTGTGYRAVAEFLATCVTNGVSSPCRSARSAVGIPPFNIAPTLTPPVAPTNLGVRP